MQFSAAHRAVHFRIGRANFGAAGRVFSLHEETPEEEEAVPTLLHRHPGWRRGLHVLRDPFGVLPRLAGQCRTVARRKAAVFVQQAGRLVLRCTELLGRRVARSYTDPLCQDLQVLRCQDAHPRLLVWVLYVAVFHGPAQCHQCYRGKRCARCWTACVHAQRVPVRHNEPAGKLQQYSREGKH